MNSIKDPDYQAHMKGMIDDGFVLDPPGYERLSLWTHQLMNIVHARANFEYVRDHPFEPGDLNNVLRHQAFFVSGIMAYCRCYVSAGTSIPKLDAKNVYKESPKGMAVHRRLIGLRNKIAAHSDQSDLMRLTLAVRDEPDRIVVRHLSTYALPIPEIVDFLQAVSETDHAVTLAINKYLDRLTTNAGKLVTPD